MYADDIDHVLYNDHGCKPFFRGCFPSDRLPKKLSNGTHCMVINLDKAKGKGTHWVCFFRQNDNKGFYMDSYGMAPYIKPIKKFVKENCTYLWYNNITLQGLNSETCGMYCIVFLKEISRGSTPRHFLTNFTTNHDLNDRMIKSLVYK